MMLFTKWIIVLLMVKELSSNMPREIEEEDEMIETEIMEEEVETETTVPGTEIEIEIINVILLQVVASIVARMVTGLEIVLMKVEETVALTVEALVILHVNAKKREEVDLILIRDQEAEDPDPDPDLVLQDVHQDVVQDHLVALNLLHQEREVHLRLLREVHANPALQQMERKNHHKRDTFAFFFFGMVAINNGIWYGLVGKSILWLESWVMVWVWYFLSSGPHSSNLSFNGFKNLAFFGLVGMVLVLVLVWREK